MSIKQNVFDHSVLLLRAMGPVSFNQLKRELIVQTPGIDASNAEQYAREFIADATAQGVIETLDDGCIDMAYATDPRD